MQLGRAWREALRQLAGKQVVHHEMHRHPLGPQQLQVGPLAQHAVVVQVDAQEQIPLPGQQRPIGQRLTL